MVKLMLHRPLQTGRQELPQIEAKDAEGKQGWAKKFLLPYFFCRLVQCSVRCAVADEHVWKAPFLGGPFFTGPMVYTGIKYYAYTHSTISLS